MQIDSTRLIGDKEALVLHQLRLLEWMGTLGRRRTSDDPQSIAAQEPTPLPEMWHLTKGVERRRWHQECISKWLKRKRGTVKVVSGAEKTPLALFIAQLLQNTEDKELRLGVVVPTSVLMHQWHDALVEHGNLPENAIGRLGGGYDETFDGGRRILIAVLASASRRLPVLVKDANLGDHLLLIADECQLAGVKQMSHFFKTKCKWALGLSAAPRRAEDDDARYNNSRLGRKLGRVIFELTLSDALREGVIPRIAIHHYGLTMTAEERARYDALSRSIAEATAILSRQRDPRAQGDILSWAGGVAARDRTELGSLAEELVRDSSRRRELLAHLQARHDAAIRLIEREVAANPDARVIVFHECADRAMELFAALHRRGLPVIAEQSELAAPVREAGLDLFRRGVARILISARAHIDGFNVPAVDAGIVVASTESVRQRVQGLGRLLRRRRGPAGEETASCVHVLYAADSTEETTYGNIDWNESPGVAQNVFYRWDVDGEPRIHDRPPPTPLPTELQIDPSSLEPGAPYPGRYEGLELSCDSQRNVRNVDGQYASNAARLAEAILQIKESGGTFRVTPTRRLALVRVPSNEEWETRYVTTLAEPLQFEAQVGWSGSIEEAIAWAIAARTGDLYPFSAIPLINDGLRFRHESGGVIGKKVIGGEVLALQGAKAADARKGADAVRLIGAIDELEQIGERVSSLKVNEARHVLYRKAGHLIFICALDAGLEFSPTRLE